MWGRRERLSSGNGAAASDREEVVTDKPVTTYIVSIFEKQHWQTILTTKDKAEQGGRVTRSMTPS